MVGHGVVRIGLTGHEPANGQLLTLGIDWLLMARDAGDELLIALPAVQWVQGLDRQSAEPGWEGAVGARLGLRVALRRILRDRSAVTMGLTSGDILRGRLERVGDDHVELESPEAFATIGRASVFTSTLPLTSIAYLRRR